MLTLFMNALRQRLLAGCTALLLLSMSLFVSSCDDLDGVIPFGPKPSVRISNSPTLGPYLVDKDGNTLYYFAFDVTGTPNCTGACAARWPAFYDPNLVVGKGLDPNDFATITGTDGRLHTTYQGWPLYYFAPQATPESPNVREAPGIIGGDNFGSVWFVTKPNYALRIARATVTNKTTNQSAAKSFLVDNKARTLYVFAPDRTSPATQPNCIGPCANVWPPFFESGRVLPTALSINDFGVITRPDGPNGTTRQQTTYKGVPLYYFVNDNATRGKTEGEGIGNVWSVATP
ncbi:COG4315 family predicted lipoprotein [Hymenobacter sp. HD11105]